MDMPLFASTTAAAALAGGIYSVLPAYQAELYGQKHVGSIYGMTMLYGSLAALIGTLLLFLLLSLLTVDQGLILSPNAKS